MSEYPFLTKNLSYTGTSSNALAPTNNIEILRKIKTAINYGSRYDDGDSIDGSDSSSSKHEDTSYSSD